jgi:hypothetical protein
LTGKGTAVDVWASGDVLYEASTQTLADSIKLESCLLFDHDQKYGLEVPAALPSLQITGVQTSIPELRNAGWAAAGAICSTTSSP